MLQRISISNKCGSCDPSIYQIPLSITTFVNNDEQCFLNTKSLY